ncbi:MAG TPA: CopD family protein [Dehalococcoidia bacterium]|nr:CopD family protein [Dehalococcoidia bacterium]
MGKGTTLRAGWLERPVRRCRWSWIGAVLLVACVVGLLPFAGAAPVQAHAVLIRSDPAQNARLTASPAKIDLFFSEALDHKFSTISVRDTSGGRHEKGPVAFTSDPTEMTVGVSSLSPGFYTVAWTTVSAVDGHRLDGTYPITVLNPDGSTPAGVAPAASSGGGGAPGVSPFDSALRWLLLLGLIGITGGFGFAAFVLFPAAEELAAAEREQGRGFALWLLGAVVPAAALVAAVVNLAALLRQAELNGSLGEIGSLLSARSGTYWIIRELLIVAAAGVAWLLTRQERRPNRPAVYGELGLGGLLGLGAMLTMSLTSHAAAGRGALWATGSDFLHLAGVGLWLGALAQLPALLTIRRGLDGEPRARFLGRALRNFSTLAVLCVGLVLLTGTFNALVQLDSWSAFSDTVYGRTLLIKLILLVPLLGFGLLNAVYIARRFERRALAGEEAGSSARRLERSAVGESLFGAAVIAATAVMVFLVPAKDANAQSAARKAATNSAVVSSVYRNQAAAGDLNTTLTVSPNRVGQNDFKVLLTPTDPNENIADVQRVQLRFQFSSTQVGGSTLDLAPVAGTPGLYEGSAANFSFVGDWRVAVNVRRTGHDDVNGVYTVQVPDVTGATTAATLSTRSRGITAFPAQGISSEQALGAVLVAVGAALFVFRKRIWNVNPWLGTAGVFGISGFVVVGLVVVVAGIGKSSQTGSLVQNPVPADERSVADGKAIYAQNCVICHGATGHGDGPGAAALNPKPLDLTVHVGLHPDGQLFDWISNGIPRTSMPPWKDKLSAQQRWDLINYLRTLSVTGDAAPGTATPAGAAVAGR